MKLARIALAVPLLMLGAQHGAPVLLQPLMRDVVAPQARLAGDIALNAADDDGKPVPARLTSADWAKLIEAGESIGAAATRLAEAPAIKVAPAGARLQNEETPGAPNATKVQGFIDRDGAGFADQARGLAVLATRLTEAARKHDAAALMEVSGQLDESCSACHGRYWYPDQGAK